MQKTGVLFTGIADGKAPPGCKQHGYDRFEDRIKYDIFRVLVTRKFHPSSPIPTNRKTVPRTRLPHVLQTAYPGERPAS